MTDDQSGFPWLPAAFTEQMQEASEQAMESQAEMMQQFMSPAAGGEALPDLSAFAGTAMFKTRVQSSGRLSIPDAEREALDIEEGDIVQTIVVPIKRNRGDSND